jgi:hypothetical protein
MTSGDVSHSIAGQDCAGIAQHGTIIAADGIRLLRMVDM